MVFIQSSAGEMTIKIQSHVMKPCRLCQKHCKCELGIPCTPRGFHFHPLCFAEKLRYKGMKEIT